MKIALLFVFVAVGAQPDPRGRGERRFQPEPTYSPETPFRENVPAPVFGAGHNRQPYPQRYWQEEPTHYQSPWDSSRPFGNFEHGGGRDSGEEDGRGSEGSSGRDQPPAKVVGVNMQMVAGMYPDGHYSPLSGPYEEDRRGGRPTNNRDRSPSRIRGGPPFREGLYLRERESDSPPSRSFFGPKYNFREEDNYEKDEIARREFEEKMKRYPEEFDRRDRKSKPEEEGDDGFRGPNKGGRLHMGRKHPESSKEAPEQPEDMGRFRQHPRHHDSREQQDDGEEPRKLNNRQPEGPRNERFPTSEKVRDREESHQSSKLMEHLVDGEAGTSPKPDVNKRTTLPEEPLSENTTISFRTTSSE